MFFFPSYVFFLSFAFFSRGKLGATSCCSCSHKRKVQLSTRAGTWTVVPFCVSIPSLVDDLSSTWMNGMLMQMPDPAALTLLGNEIQADYKLLCLLLTIPKKSLFFHFELRHAQVINTISVLQTVRFLTNIKVMISPNPNCC